MNVHVQVWRELWSVQSVTINAPSRRGVHLSLPILSLTHATPRILIATTNRTFKSERAKRDFGYKPDVSMAEALKRTLASFQHLRNPYVQKKAL